MIYTDSSVVIASLFGEERQPGGAYWSEHLVSSRLLEYEIWVAVHRAHRGEELAEAVRQLTGRIELIEMSPVVLGRSMEPFPARLRALDALHLATADYLRAQGSRLKLATYDARLRDAAHAMKFDVVEP